MHRSVVIAGYARSPFHFARKGALARIRPDQLAADVVKGLIARTGVNPADVEDLILGNAFPEGEQGLNLGRNVALLAGLPETVAGCTLNRFCASSMSAIHNAAGMIQMGAGDVFICGGVESMTRVPMGGFNPMPHPGLLEENPGAYMGMGETAENLVEKYKITRTAQEEFAVHSHQKAAAAQTNGKFDDEIVPINTPEGTIKQDGTIRPESTLEQLAALNPAFRANGLVTAGTSSPLTDGAAAVLVASEEYAKANDLPILARLRAIAVVGCDPKIMGIGPIPAGQKALERAGMSLSDVDLFELNEAFAVQALSVITELGLNQSMERINLDGGAIALGHPLGASGARITGKAASLLKREGKELALAFMCVGGGMGTATVLEAA